MAVADLAPVPCSPHRFPSRNLELRFFPKTDSSGEFEIVLEVLPFGTRAPRGWPGKSLRRCR